MKSLASSPGLAAATSRRSLRIRGLVQGVGFRPHVFRCARHCQLTGFVRNDPEGVMIEVEGTELDEFIRLLREEAPPLARIDSLIEAPLQVRGDREFMIEATRSGAAAGAAIPADTALCRQCLGELFDPGNRRYLHPFIACCDCGPRFTMSRSLPYDRATTAMADFRMCPACETEYTDPSSRRFHAEPVACHNCGPRLSMDIDTAATALAEGKIIALKGLGGYHLACDATHADTVQTLRERKRRDGKPFAIMVLNLASAASLVELSGPVSQALDSPERPVVVAPAAHGAGDLSPDLSRGLNTLGVMLPYTAIHYLLFHSLLGKPAGADWLDEAQSLALVLTSANLSGDPLVIDEQEAEEKLGAVADLFLHHDRGIARRADDSVLRANAHHSVIIRRARGFAPHAIKLSASARRTLAMGAHLKSTLCMTRGNRAFVSQHIGDLDSPGNLDFHRNTARELQNMLRSTPQLIACDLNHDYASTRAAENLSEAMGLPLVRVQHHHAHIGAVLAEHKLEGPVLGMALDGHGLGSNGESWGGELLEVDGGAFQRAGHLAAIPLPGGDLAARQPWRLAAGILAQLGRSNEIPARFRDEPLAPALARLLEKGEWPGTTAAGRLFDAAAGLLGLCNHTGFEGEAPMLLEGQVQKCRYTEDLWLLDGGRLDFQPLLARLSDCTDPRYGAELFHGTLVNALCAWAEDIARDRQLDTIVLAGGCFLNAQLAHELPRRLRERGLKVLLPVTMPPNDGAISLGQAWVAQRSAP